KLHHVRTWNGWNLVPKDGARCCRRSRFRRSCVAELKIFDALSIEMYLAAIIAREPLEQFRERSLRAVAAVDKRRNNREPQVSLSSGAQVALRERWPRTAPKERGWAAGTASRAAAKNMRSAGSPHKTGSRQRWQEKAKRTRTKKSRTPGETRANLSAS